MNYVTYDCVFQIPKVNCVRNLKTQDLGLLQGMWIRPLSFLGLAASQARGYTRGISQLLPKALPSALPTPPPGTAHLFSEDQTHRLWHCLMCLTEGLKP